MRELLKQIYVAERLQPPSMSAVQSAYSTIWSRASNPAYLRDLVSSGDYAKVGIYALEAYGIFKVCTYFCQFKSGHEDVLAKNLTFVYARNYELYRC